MNKLNKKNSKNEEDILLFFDQPWETKQIPIEKPNIIYNYPKEEKTAVVEKTVRFNDNTPNFILLSMPLEKNEF